MSNKLELVSLLMMLWTNCFPPFSALCNYNQSSLFCRFCVQPLLYSCSTFSLCPSFWCWPRESPSQSRLSWSSGQTPRSRSCFPWPGVSIIRNIYRFIYLTLFILLQWNTRIYAGLEICIIFFSHGWPLLSTSRTFTRWWRVFKVPWAPKTSVLYKEPANILKLTGSRPSTFWPLVNVKSSDLVTFVLTVIW